MYVGKKVTRVDAHDKAMGRTRYTDDLCDKSAYIIRVLHSTIANGRVISIDTSEAEKIPGVVKIFTCFDLKEKHYFPTAGHPWSTDPSHQDVADRLVMTDRVRFYGDDIGAVVAEDEVAAAQALRAIKVEYEEYPFVMDVQDAMKEDAPQIHENYPGNVLKHTTIRKGNYEEAIREPGLIKVEGWYSTPTVQHCHIENFICTAQMEGERIRMLSSTQIPHIVRRVVGQALGIDWGRVQIIKPYIGGGFGNKQDVLYEPLCAWVCMNLGGHLVKLDVPREETFVSNRVRHAIRSHIVSRFVRTEPLRQESWRHSPTRERMHPTATASAQRVSAHSRSFTRVTILRQMAIRYLPISRLPEPCADTVFRRLCGLLNATPMMLRQRSAWTRSRSAERT